MHRFQEDEARKKAEKAGAMEVLKVRCHLGSNAPCCSCACQCSPAQAQVLQQMPPPSTAAHSALLCTWTQTCTHLQEACVCQCTSGVLSQL